MGLANSTLGTGVMAMFSGGRGVGLLLAGARGRLVGLLAALAGLLVLWAVAVLRLLTRSGDPGGGERHASTAGLGSQPGRGGAPRVHSRPLLFPTVVGVLMALSLVWGPIG